MQNVVVDTDVVFQGLTGHGAGYRVVALWLAGDPYIRFFLCNTVVTEYQAVLRRKLSSARLAYLEPLLNLLIQQAALLGPQFDWGPSPSDRGDEFMVDCAMNANAAVVTYNLRHYRWAEKELRLRVMTPEELLRWRDEQEANR